MKHGKRLVLDPRSPAFSEMQIVSDDAPRVFLGWLSSKRLQRERDQLQYMKKSSSSHRFARIFHDNCARLRLFATHYISRAARASASSKETCYSWTHQMVNCKHVFVCGQQMIAWRRLCKRVSNSITSELSSFRTLMRGHLVSGTSMTWTSVTLCVWLSNIMVHVMWSNSSCCPCASPHSPQPFVRKPYHVSHRITAINLRSLSSLITFGSLDPMLHGVFSKELWAVQFPLYWHLPLLHIPKQRNEPSAVSWDKSSIICWSRINHPPHSGMPTLKC